MALSLQEQQTPIFDRMGRALVEATPEYWTSAVLELTQPDPEDCVEGVETGYGHSIWNADFPRDMISPTDELYAATRELELLSAAFRDDWRRLVFRIEQIGSDWRFVASFER